MMKEGESIYHSLARETEFLVMRELLLFSQKRSLINV